MATIADLIPRIACPNCGSVALSHHHNTCRACGEPLSVHKGAVRDRLAAVDASVRQIPDLPRWTVRGLGAELARCAPDAIGRGRAIFTWIADHISYDTHALFSGRRSYEAPDDVIRARRAVCAGFSALFDALCRSVGVRTVVVSGYVKGIGFSFGDSSRSGENHSWNAIHDGRSWHLVDSTWGAGSINGDRFERRFRPFYFDARPDRLIFTHLPGDPRWQLLNPPVSCATFDSLAIPKSGFYMNSLGLDSHVEATIRCGRDVTISLVAAQPVSILYSFGGNMEIGLTRAKRVLLPVTLPQPGVYQLDVFAHPSPCSPGALHDGVLSYRLVRSR